MQVGSTIITSIVYLYLRYTAFYILCNFLFLKIINITMKFPNTMDILKHFERII